MKQLFTLFLTTFALAGSVNAQLQDGVIAPNWTATDINGNTYTLYDYLDQGKTVFIDFFATWCGPCWNYHHSGALADLYLQYGPGGTNEIMVFSIEADPSTSVDAIYGLAPPTQGDWTEGTPYPIIDNAVIGDQYQISYYPTIYGICPNRTVFEVGQVGTSQLYSFSQGCPPTIPSLLSVQVFDVDCYGATNGGIRLSVNGGVQPVTYQWSNGMNADYIFDIGAGVYHCVVTDAVGHTIDTGPIIVDGPGSPLSISIDGFVDTDCNGEPGSIYIAVSGGGGDYAYQWSHGATGPAATNLPPGVYSVSVSDSYGCTETLDNLVINDAPVPVATAVPLAELTCSEPMVMLDGSGSSTGPGVAFVWSTNDGHFVSGQNTLTPVVDQPGLYTLTILDLTSFCEASVDITVIGNNTPLTVSAGTPPAITCAQSNVTLSGSGPAGSGYSYHWTTAEGHIVSGQNTPTPTVDQAGHYTLSVTSTLTGCSGTATVFVGEDVTAPQAEAGADGQLTCSLDSIVLDGTASSAGPGISYSWTTQDGHFSGVTDAALASTDAPGTYRLTVFNDQNGCSAVDSVVITQAPVLAAEIALSEAVGCFGGSDGSLSVQINSGTEPYTFAWSNGATGAAADNLGAGSYTVSIQDANDCVLTLSGTVTGPDLLSANASATGETGAAANDGTVIANPSGGVPPYVFAWSNGATEAFLTGLPAGSYTVTVTDGNGCSAVQTVAVSSFNCTLAGSLEISQVSCFGAADGRIIVSVAGGTEPFEFNWSTGAAGAAISGLAPGTYSVTITDGAACPQILTASITQPTALDLSVTTTDETSAGASDGTALASAEGGTPPYSYAWSNGNAGQENGGLAPGTYSLTLTDANGCSIVENFTVAAFQCALALTFEVQTASCAIAADGGITANLSGSNGESAFAWDNGLSGPAIQGLIPGTYSVTATDGAGCQTTASIVVPEEDTQAPQIRTQDITLFLGTDGQVALMPGMLDNGTADNCELVSLAVDIRTFDCSHLGSQAVTLTAVDAAGNSASAMATVTVRDTIAPQLRCPENLVATSCNGQVFYEMPEIQDNCSADGDPELLQGLPSGAIFPAGATEVVFAYADASGNAGSCRFLVMVNDPLAAELATQAVSCHGASDGSAAISAAGGAGSFHFSWSNGQSGPALENLTAGSYSVEVSDTAGCLLTLSFDIQEPSPILVVVDAVSNDVNASGTGSIEVSVSGGMPPYTYEWMLDGSLVSGTEDPGQLSAGVYQLVVTDANGCTFHADPVVVDNLTNARDRDLDQMLSVFPNPSNGRIRMEIAGGLPGQGMLRLFNPTGCQVLSAMLIPAGGQNAVLDLGTLSAGIYFIHLQVNDRIIVRKVVLSR